MFRLGLNDELDAYEKYGYSVIIGGLILGHLWPWIAAISLLVGLCFCLVGSVRARHRAGSDQGPEGRASTVAQKRELAFEEIVILTFGFIVFAVALGFYLCKVISAPILFATAAANGLVQRVCFVVVRGRTLRMRSKR